MNSAYRYFLVFNQTSNNFFETPCTVHFLYHQIVYFTVGMNSTLKNVNNNGNDQWRRQDSLLEGQSRTGSGAEP